MNNEQTQVRHDVNKKATARNFDPALAPIIGFQLYIFDPDDTEMFLIECICTECLNRELIQIQTGSARNITIQFNAFSEFTCARCDEYISYKNFRR